MYRYVKHIRRSVNRISFALAAIKFDLPPCQVVIARFLVLLTFVAQNPLDNFARLFWKHSRVSNYLRNVSYKTDLDRFCWAKWLTRDSVDF